MQDVNHIIEDGLLATETTGTGVHIKIGAAPADIAAGGSVTIKGTDSINKIRAKLGYSPLADAVMTSTENGALKVICIPVTASVPGTITAGHTQAANDGEITLSGTPYNSFGIVTEITGKGGLNTATFRYSLNGGYTFTEDITVPLSGTYQIAEAGVSLTFVVAEDKSFEIGDIFHWETTEPQLSTANVLEAMDTIKSIKDEAEYVHIVGAASAATWAAVSAAQTELQERYHKPLFVMLEAYRQGEESLAEYMSSLLEDRKKVQNRCIQVVASWLLYTGMDGAIKEINAAGIVAGLYSRVTVNKSIGEVAAISLSEYKIHTLLLPEDRIEELDAAGYLTLRQYDGLLGYYVTNARMFSPPESDFKYAEDIRVLHKIICTTRKAALHQLQADVDLANVAADLQIKAQLIQSKVEEMVDAKEISSVSVTVPEDQDILTTETLNLAVRYVPRGKIRTINIYVGVSNPYAS